MNNQIVQFQISQTLIPATYINWQTKHNKAATLTVRFPKSLYQPVNGEAIALLVEEQICFAGFIFTVQFDEQFCEIVAYDQLRYLMFKDSYVFQQKTVGHIVTAIAKDMSISIGDIEMGQYAMDIVMEDKKLLDIIQQAISNEEEQTGNMLTLLDKEGKLYLAKQDNFIVNDVISPKTAITHYTQKTSIDCDTFNRIKLAQKNKKKGLRTISVAQGETVAEWGVLQYYKRVDEKLTEAQVQMMANRLLEQKNRQVETLNIHAAGNASCKAGCYVPIEIENINELVFINGAKHEFAQNGYTMQLNVQKI